MTKDPAFLFYSKDWIEGTAEMMPDEKGVYIDLLCYQHQRGDLPGDTKRLARMVGLGIEEFDRIWSVIGEKFEANGKRTLNRKLNDVMTERKDKGHRNKIIGVFGSLCRQSGLSKEKLNTIRSQFKVSDFEQIDSETISERLSEWFNKRIALLETEDENGNEDSIIISLKTDFDIFWKAYDYNVGIRQAQSEWKLILDEMPQEVSKILEHVPKYVKSKPQKQYRKKPENYLSERVWMDEILSESQNTDTTKLSGQPKYGENKF